MAIGSQFGNSLVFKALDFSFCSTSLKIASWYKRAAGALAIVSAFQVSGKKKEKTVKGAHFSAGATSLKEYSKNFCNIKLVVTNRSYKVGGEEAGNVRFWLGAFPFQMKGGFIPKKGNRGPEHTIQK